MTAPTVETQTLTFSKTINAPTDFLWSMLTNRDDLCDWLCRDAHVNVRENGFATFIWGDNDASELAPHAYGVYQTVVDHEKLIMTWHDGTDQVTTVKFLIEANDDENILQVWHKGFTDDERIAHYQDFWDTHLTALKRMLETGERPEIADRVIIGVMVDLGDAAESGHRVDRVIEGYSAASAGLEAGDIIIEVDERKIDAETRIIDVTEGKKPGDTMAVTYVRDSETHRVDVELKGYPIPPIPATFAEMAQQHRDEYDRVNVALATALEGISDDVATIKPEGTDWTVLETLAHMILNQRHTLEWLSTYANGPRRINPYTRESERIAALIATFPTTDELFTELQATQNETVAMIDAFDPQMEQRKDYMWWMVFEIWQTENMAIQRIAEIEALKVQAATA